MSARSGSGEEFHNAEHGYYVDIPSDWVRVPDHIIRVSLPALQASRDEVAFQPDASDEWLAFPYIFISTFPYSEMGFPGQMPEEHFARHVSNTSDLEPGDIDAYNAQWIRAVPEGIILDASNRRYIWCINTENDEGRVRVLAFGYFGREAVVQVGFYALSSHWDEHAKVGRAIISSLRFEPGKAYRPRVYPRPFLRRHLWKGLSVGAVLLAAAAIATRRLMFGRVEPE